MAREFSKKKKVGRTIREKELGKRSRMRELDK